MPLVRSMKLYTYFCCGVAAVLTSITAADAQTLYAATGSHGTPGELYTVDLNTNTFTEVAPITLAGSGNAIGITGLAFNPITGVLYGVTVNNTANGNTLNAHLVTIDPVTGVATDKGALGIPVSDISFSSNGTLYGFQTGTQTASGVSLLTINQTTGSANPIGATDLTFTLGGGLAVNPNGTVYLSATGTGGTLDTVNPSTGVRTPGPSLVGAPFDGAIAAMAFNGSTLYAANGDIAPPNGLVTDVELVTINLVNGAVNDLFSLPDNTDAIAFRPAAVPEPSIIGLIVFGSLGLSLSRFYHKRRN
jgi:hypothetical protein